VSHPTTRVLAMLELLQARHQLSGAELAAGIGVDQRTVRRYALRLADLGIPVTAERGRYGGYRLLPGYRLPPTWTRTAWSCTPGAGTSPARTATAGRSGRSAWTASATSG
jgi:biotin operon repressor